MDDKTQNEYVDQNRKKKGTHIFIDISTICRGKEARDMLFNDEHNNITSLPDRSSYSSPTSELLSQLSEGLFM